MTESTGVGSSEMSKRSRALFGKGRSAEGGQDFEDRVIHRGSHGTCLRVVAEAHSKVAVHR